MNNLYRWWTEHGVRLYLRDNKSQAMTITEEQASTFIQERERLIELIKPAIFQFMKTTGAVPQIEIIEKKQTMNTHCGKITLNDDWDVQIKMYL